MKILMISIFVEMQVGNLPIILKNLIYYFPILLKLLRLSLILAWIKMHMMSYYFYYIFYC